MSLSPRCFMEFQGRASGVSDGFREFWGRGFQWVFRGVPVVFPGTLGHDELEEVPKAFNKASRGFRGSQGRVVLYVSETLHGDSWEHPWSFRWFQECFRGFEDISGVFQRHASDFRGFPVCFKGFKGDSWAFKGVHL